MRTMKHRRTSLRGSIDTNAWHGKKRARCETGIEPRLAACAEVTRASVWQSVMAMSTS